MPNRTLVTTVLPCFATDISFDDWENIKLLKSNFINNKCSKESLFSIIPSIVLESWNRSKNNNISLSKNIKNNVSDYNSFRETISDNIMLQSTEKMLSSELARKLQKRTGYYITLYDKNGVMIFTTGGDETIDYFKKYHLVPGTMLNEEEIGTTAHSLAMQTGQIVQLIGPYNYLDIFNNCVLTAIPIFFDNEIVATLEVIQRDMTQETICFTNNVFGMMLSVISYVITALKLKHEKLKVGIITLFANLQLSLSNTGKGTIILDQDKNIVYVCKIAIDILNYKDDTKKMSSYLKDINKLIQNIDKHGNIKTTKLQKINSQEYISIGNHSLRFTKNSGSLGTILYVARDTNSSIQKKSSTRYSIDSMIGKHDSIIKLKEYIKSVSGTIYNVLILGESGTGKEIIAQAIHDESGLSGSFVAINCASIPENLIESELFGYIGGAFTDASKQGSEGKIEHANNGTLFLDEIGDMPLKLQPVLLRVLEERQVIRIGAKEPKNINIRVISATNTDLYKKVLDKTFREDLYYRLSVINIDTPPLRERDNDILLLSEHFISKAIKDQKREDITISDNVKNILLNYPWPGNIRQLENAIISAVSRLNDTSVIEEIHLPSIIRTYNPKNNLRKDCNTLEVATYNIIKSTLEENCGNILKTAKKLGVSRATIYRKLMKPK